MGLKPSVRHELIYQGSFNSRRSVEGIGVRLVILITLVILFSFLLLDTITIFGRWLYSDTQIVVVSSSYIYTKLRREYLLLLHSFYCITW